MTHQERARHRARKDAVRALFSADLAGVDPSDALDSLPDPMITENDVELLGSDFARSLVAGVTSNSSELDAKIAAVAENWTIERMSPVDRAILRMALFEITALDDIPVGASIDDAVELAKCYSTTDSGRFVNGLLGRLVTLAE